MGRGSVLMQSFIRMLQNDRNCKQDTSELLFRFLLEYLKRKFDSRIHVGLMYIHVKSLRHWGFPGRLLARCIIRAAELKCTLINQGKTRVHYNISENDDEFIICH